MKLFIKSIIVFCVPGIILIGVYIWTDPFKVIHNYDVYLSDYVMLERGFVSTKVFLKNYQKYDFDSFIFGSSRSCAFAGNEWDKHLSKNNKAFSFGAWTESIEGIFRKIQLIDSVKNPIKNILVIIDSDGYTFDGGNSTLEYEHFLISGKTLSEFHIKYFSLFLRKYWLIPISIDYKLFKEQRHYMKDFVGMKHGDLNPVNNDWLPNGENEILKDSIQYYEKAGNNFYSRSNIQKEAAIQIRLK